VSAPPILIDDSATGGTPPGTAAPTTAQDLSRIYHIGGLILSVAGFTDVALFYWRPHFGEAGWEFGTIAQTFDALPLPMLGLVLLSLGARSRQSTRWLRALSIVFAIVALLSVALLVLFVLDVPAALKALRAAPGASGVQTAAVLSGLKLTASKAILFGTCYALGAALLARTLWPRSRAKPARA
jgi:hypothetical protein